MSDESMEAQAWMETARQHCNNEAYYRGLVVQIGELFGEAAHISDDGSRQEDVLCAKVPELVTDAVGSLAEAKADYIRACQTVAAMHAAAVGEVTGPRVGVVEDVAALRSVALKLCRELQCPAMEYLNSAVQDAWSELFNLVEPARKV